MWAVSEMLGPVLYYNPSLHGNESMELVFQMLEEVQTEKARNLIKQRMTGCRLDYNIIMHTIEGFG